MQAHVAGPSVLSQAILPSGLEGPCAKVEIPATSGTIDAPFITTNDCIYQPWETTGPGGRAEYWFVAPRTGTYILQAVVDAPNAGLNSDYLNYP